MSSFYFLNWNNFSFLLLSKSSFSTSFSFCQSEKVSFKLKLMNVRGTSLSLFHFGDITSSPSLLWNRNFSIVAICDSSLKRLFLWTKIYRLKQFVVTHSFLFSGVVLNKKLCFTFIISYLQILQRLNLLNIFLLN